MILATQTLPEGAHSGYVAAAYVFFLALVLVYVAIMAWRLTRVERAVRELKDTPRDGERSAGSAPSRGVGTQTGEPPVAAGERDPDRERDRETV
jgi:hypothetical protein